MPTATTGVLGRILQAQRKQLAGLVEVRGIGRLKRLYAESRAELADRLRSMEKAGRGQVFGAHHLRIMLIQAHEAIAQLEDRMGDQLEDTGRLVAAAAPHQLVKAVKDLEHHFTGHTPVVQAESAAVFQRLHRDTEPSLLDRFRKSKRLYGAPVVAAIRDQLSKSLLQGQSVDEAVDRVAGTSGVFEAQRWRAERIVRTELAFASNFVAHKGMQVLAQTGGPTHKKLIETWDDRTGDDSKILDGQIRRTDEPFVYKPPAGKKGYPPFMMPPGRPNDRAVVIPWSLDWGEGGGTVAPEVVSKPTPVPNDIHSRLFGQEGHAEGEIVALAHPHQLANVLWHDKPIEPTGDVRMSRVRQLFDKGPHAMRDMRPPVVVVSPGGKMEVEDGRHRILVARERGLPIEVKFQRGVAAMDEAPIPEPEESFEAKTERTAPAKGQAAETARTSAGPRRTPVAEISKELDEALSDIQHELVNAPIKEVRKVFGDDTDNLNKTMHVELEGGHVGYFKPAAGERYARHTVPEGTYYKREAAAYDLDQALGLDLVPKTVVRKGDGEGIGSFQVEHAPASQEAASQTVAGLPYAGARAVGEVAPRMEVADRGAFQKMRVLDIVSGNSDRHNGNWLRRYNSRGELVPAPIDHGLAFPTEVKVERTYNPEVANPSVHGALEPGVRDLIKKADIHKIGETLKASGLEPEAVHGALVRLDLIKQNPRLAAYSDEVIPFETREEAEGTAGLWADAAVHHPSSKEVKATMKKLYPKWTPPAK